MGNKRNRSWFFTFFKGVRDDGSIGGIRLLKHDKPTQPTFEDLLASNYNQVEDSANNVDIVNRTPAKVVQPNNLPVIIQGTNTSSKGLNNALEVIPSTPDISNPFISYTLRLKQSIVDTLDSLLGSGSLYDGPDSNNVSVGNLNAGSTGLAGATPVAILKRMLNQIINPSINANGFPLQEKGTTYIPTISGTIIPNNGTINARRILRNWVTINSPSADNFSFTDIGTNINTNFSIEADYTTAQGANTVIRYINLLFEAPIFSGCGAKALGQNQIKALSKFIIPKISSKINSYNVVNNQVFYFAYPKSWGLLVSIKDENGFESLADFLIRTETWTLVDGSNEDYYIYEYKTIQTTARLTTFNFILS